MRRVTKVCIATTVIIIFCLLFLPRVPHISISPVLNGIGIFFLAGIPSYLLYRKFQNEKEDERIWNCIEDLARLQRGLGQIADVETMKELKTQLGKIRADLHPRGQIDRETYLYIVNNP